MNKRNRFTAPVALAAALALPVLTNGCGDDPLGSLCCTDFKVGADLSNVNFEMSGAIDGQFKAFAQAASDLSAAATAAIGDVQVACRNIATGLGADQKALDDAEAKGERDRVTQLCALAVAQINAKVTAQGSLTLVAEPPKCSASIQAKAKCQGSCSGGAKCDLKANPPKCTGGKLEVACKGGCTAEGKATVSCEGSCTAECKGTCTAQGGVQCAGKCEGTCEGSTDSGGNCQGTCKGSCSATPPGVTCTGSCKGECTGSCKAEAGASVKCDGKCDADFEPIKCEGGKLEGGCQVEAKCEANCEGSVQAKAECTPPQVKLNFSGQASAEVQAYIDILTAELPNLLVVFQARGEAFVKLTGDLAASAEATVSAGLSGELSGKATACLAPIAGAIVEASKNASVSVQASGSVVGAIK